MKTQETEGNHQERYSWKKHFLLELYKLGMKRETVQALYKFIDWIMRLPNELEGELFTEIKAIKEATKIPYLTTA
ncbi:MAG: hypothetical protein ACE5I1_08045 [bacterium]